MYIYTVMLNDQKVMNTDFTKQKNLLCIISLSVQLLTGHAVQGGSTGPGRVTGSCPTPQCHGKRRTISVSRTGGSFRSSQTQNCWCENLHYFKSYECFHPLQPLYFAILYLCYISLLKITIRN